MTNIPPIVQWAKRHQVPPEALSDLYRVLQSAIPEVITPATSSEAVAQQRIRLAAPHNGVRLWRNNVGACLDEHGNMIRYGLANESAALNKKIKSSDLIGITPITVQPEHVGAQFGLFTAIECKRPGWRYSGNAREAAQLSFIQLVMSMGGFAQFATDPGEVWNDG